MSFYRMQRGWCDKAVFGREPYCRRAAWVWLIENAAFAPHNGLDRGQIRTSFRFLAMAWRWSVPAIQRWMVAAQKAEMIRYTTDTACTVITICNYSKYQLPIHLADTGPDTQPIHNRYTTDTPPDTNYKEGKKEERKEDSGAIAPGDADPVKQLWDRGLVIVGKHNRALLGKLCKQHGKVVVMEAIVFTEQETRADPLSFLLGCLKHTKEINGHGGKQSPGEKLFEGAYRAALAYDARQRVGQPFDEPLLDGERSGGDAPSADRGLDRGLSRVSH
jgi:hypothetical protein